MIRLIRSTAAAARANPGALIFLLALFVTALAAGKHLYG